MSIDKTLRLTDESGSDIISILDGKPRGTMNSYFDEFSEPVRLTNSHSLKNLRLDSNRIQDLEYENELLKAEIVSLKKQLRSQKQTKGQYVVELEQEVQKLKKLIQKSYYSLKGLEKDNISYQVELKACKQRQKKHEQRATFLEIKTQEMVSCINSLKENHSKEVKLIWQRVSHLQKNLQSVVVIIDQDKRDDQYYRTRLRNSKAVEQSSSSMKSIRFY